MICGKNGGPIFRLVNWTWSLETSKNLDDESIDLYAITLAWTFTTSNRFLRDHATKALVNLLTDCLEATVRLVDRFADVDDPYVAERVYAVAYGVAMRSYDIHGIGKLAQCVYKHVFESGYPPVHILLRDYARGVIEQAIHLNANIQVEIDRIRPPYSSVFPHLPSDDEIETLLSKLAVTETGSNNWARNRIINSIQLDDFSRYVIGDNKLHPRWFYYHDGEIQDKKENDANIDPLQLDFHSIKRYILWRVFDLGWTSEKFEEFDHFAIGYKGRLAAKPERIGKKYQWLAYHEIMAYVSDHFLIVSPEDQSKWLNLQGLFFWKQAMSADYESNETEIRNLFFIWNSYLVPTQYKDAFMEWANKADFTGRWMPEPPETDKVFLGEYGKAPAFWDRYELYENELEEHLAGCPAEAKKLLHGNTHHTSAILIVLILSRYPYYLSAPKP